MVHVPFVLFYLCKCFAGNLLTCALTVLDMDTDSVTETAVLKLKKHTKKTQTCHTVSNIMLINQGF